MLWFISRNYPPVIGGAERQLEMIVSKLIEKGVSVAVFTDTSLGKDISSNNINNQLLGIIGQKIRSIKYIVKGIVSLIRTPTSLVVSNGLGASSWIAVLYRFLSGARVIIRLRSGLEYYQRYGGKKIRGILHMLPLIFASKIVVLQSEVAVFLSSQLGISENRFIVIPNGVDTTKYHPNQENIENRNVEAHKIILLFVGRLRVIKGLHLLIASLGEREYFRKRFKLVVIGDGPERERLETMSSELKLDVQFLGIKYDVRPYLGSSDIFIQPSIYEGMSNALLEALSFGMPVMISDAGSGKELIHNSSCGIVFRSNSVSELSDALACVEKKSKKELVEMGVQSRIIIEKGFSIEATSIKWYELLICEMN